MDDVQDLPGEEVDFQEAVPRRRRARKRHAPRSLRRGNRFHWPLNRWERLCLPALGKSVLEQVMGVVTIACVASYCKLLGLQC